MSDDKLTRLCSGCALWHRRDRDIYGGAARGECQHPPHKAGSMKSEDTYYDPTGLTPSDVLVIKVTDSDGRYPIATHPQFGCIHWQPKEAS